jgi:hypothetical protein
MLAAAGNGIRITGVVLVADDVKEFSGTSKGGKPYSFAVREIQMFTGRNTVLCKFQQDTGTAFPAISIGQTRTFKVEGFRMNGNVPVLTVSDPE